MSNLSLFHQKLIYKKAAEFKRLFPDSDLVLSLFDGEKWVRFEFLSGNLKKPISDSIFDLASITKVFVSSLVLQLVKDQKLKLNSLVYKIIPTLEHFNHLQLIQLLNHTSHLDLIEKFSPNQKYSKSEFENIILNGNNLRYNRALNKYLYSDLNYIYIGEILKKITSRSLTDLNEEQNQKFNFKVVFNPLNTVKDTELLVKTSKDTAAGIVNDFKCRSLGGVAGHAGLFGDIEDLENCAYNWLFNLWHFSSEIYNQAIFTPKNSNSDMDSRYGLTFRNGKYTELSNHSGFTGPTIVFNPKLKIGLVHLNNYTFSDPSDKAREIFIKWNFELCSLLPI